MSSSKEMQVSTLQHQTNQSYLSDHSTQLLMQAGVRWSLNHTEESEFSDPTMVEEAV